MIVEATAPTRISLFGGGTDIESYSSKYGGAVISCAINLHQHLLMYPDSGCHTFPSKANPNFYKTFLDQYGLTDQTTLDCRFDGLIESGIGSSASVAVALLGAINRRLNLGMSKGDIAQKAWEIEVNKLGLFGGKQDQWAASFGGINYMEFTDHIEVVPLNNLVDSIEKCAVLVFTGETRKSPKIQEGFKEPTQEQINALHELKSLIKPAFRAFEVRDVEKIGWLLDQSWQYKQKSNKGITTSEVSQLYDKGKSLGAWGGKLLGSGGGGYMLFWVPPDQRDCFSERLGLPQIDFSIDYNGLQTRII